MHGKVACQFLQTMSCRDPQRNSANIKSGIIQSDCISIVKAEKPSIVWSVSIDILVGVAIVSFVGLTLFMLYCFRRKRKRRHDNEDEENRPLLGDHNKKMHFVRRSSTYYQWNKSPPPTSPPAPPPSSSEITAPSLGYKMREPRPQQPTGRICTEESLSDRDLSSIPIIQSPIDDENDLRQQQDWETRRKALLKKYAKNDEQGEANAVNSRANCHTTHTDNNISKKVLL